MKPITLIKRLHSEAKKYNERRLIVLAGDRDRSYDLLNKFVSNFKGRVALLYYHEKKIDRAECFHLKDSIKLLGTTYDMLILDLCHSLQPSDIGKLYGIVRGGGLIFLVTPPLEEWKQMLNRYHYRILTPPYTERDIRRNFVPWFIRKLMESDGVAIIEDGRIIKEGFFESKLEEKKRLKFPARRKFSIDIYKLAITQDQVDFIKLMEEMIEKPDPLTAIVLKSNRGRGKSSAIGIALPALIERLLDFKREIRVMLVAPEIENVQEIFKFSMISWEKLGYKPMRKTLGENIVEISTNRSVIEYWKPIDAIEKYADIIVVDEAASIPPNILLNFLDRTNRIIYSSTVHGYEGAGRSFSIRFLERLRSKKLRLLEFEMEEPVRYSKNDPIEKWAFDALLLDAEAPDLKEVKVEDLSYKKFDMNKITLDEKSMREYFGILILAHYKNNPNDLAILLDAPNQLARALTYKGKAVCSLQLALEGGMGEEDCLSLFYGRKAVLGNVIPQLMIRHYRKKDYGKFRGMRIVRIAVHPNFFNNGIGSRALNEVIDEAGEIGLDYVGASFGATYNLLKFWIKNGFLPMHISTSRNDVSAEFSVTVMKALSKEFERELEDIRRKFVRRFMYWLVEPLRDLNTKVALAILDSYGEKMNDLGLNSEELSRLLAYIWDAGLTYRTVKDCLFKLSYNFFLSDRKQVLSERERLLMLAKNLQCKGWDRVADIIGMDEDSCKEMLVKTVEKVIMEFYGDLDEVLEFQKEVQVPAEEEKESGNP